DMEDPFEHYLDDYEEEDLYFLDEEYSTSHLLATCSTGVLNSVRYNLLLTVSFALLQKTVLALNFISYSSRHLLISFLGCSLLFLWDIPYTVSITIISTAFFFIALMLIPPSKYVGWITTLTAFTSLVLLETMITSDNFSYRGILMILAMKVSSLAFDLSKNKYSVTVPEVLGYLLNPCTIIFGPSLPFTNYRIAFIPLSLTVSIPSLISSNSSISVSSSLYFPFSFIPSYFSLLSSRLFMYHSDSFPRRGNSSSVGDAQSFRFSHYFICFWSQGLISLGGEESPLIVHLHQVEMPRSLTQLLSLYGMFPCINIYSIMYILVSVPSDQEFP
ncbi:hypothetical protein PENTCL1PPCAC_26438, partial [Pristionchus entomophagus]